MAGSQLGSLATVARQQALGHPGLSVQQNGVAEARGRVVVHDQGPNRASGESSWTPH
jgi:hypothetical protein